MAANFQATLLDVTDRIGPDRLGDTVRRTELSHGAWVDIRPGWMTGADALFEWLFREVPWRAERRPMYDRVVDVPRLLCFYDEGEPLPHPALAGRGPALPTCADGGRRRHRGRRAGRSNR